MVGDVKAGSLEDDARRAKDAPGIGVAVGTGGHCRIAESRRPFKCAATGGAAIYVNRHAVQPLFLAKFLADLRF